jgi:hypothetical protein
MRRPQCQRILISHPSRHANIWKDTGPAYDYIDCCKEGELRNRVRHATSRHAWCRATIAASVRDGKSRTRHDSRSLSVPSSHQHVGTSLQRHGQRHSIAFSSSACLRHRLSNHAAYDVSCMVPPVIRNQELHAGQTTPGTDPNIRTTIAGVEDQASRFSGLRFRNARQTFT